VVEWKFKGRGKEKKKGEERQQDCGIAYPPYLIFLHAELVSF
jgi:hypothetical protein